MQLLLITGKDGGDQILVTAPDEYDPQLVTELLFRVKAETKYGIRFFGQPYTKSVLHLPKEFNCDLFSLFQRVG